MTDTTDDLRDAILNSVDGTIDEDVPADPIRRAVTIAEVAAAAIVSIETLAQVLPEEAAKLMIEEYDRRAEQFASTPDE